MAGGRDVREAVWRRVAMNRSKLKGEEGLGMNQEESDGGMR